MKCGTSLFFRTSVGNKKIVHNWWEMFTSGWNNWKKFFSSRLRKKSFWHFFVFFHCELVCHRKWNRRWDFFSSQLLLIDRNLSRRTAVARCDLSLSRRTWMACPIKEWLKYFFDLEDQHDVGYALADGNEPITSQITAKLYPKNSIIAFAAAQAWVNGT